MNGFCYINSMSESNLVYCPGANSINSLALCPSDCVSFNRRCHRIASLSCLANEQISGRIYLKAIRIVHLTITYSTKGQRFPEEKAISPWWLTLQNPMRNQLIRTVPFHRSCTPSFNQSSNSPSSMTNSISLFHRESFSSSKMSLLDTVSPFGIQSF